MFLRITRSSNCSLVPLLRQAHSDSDPNGPKNFQLDSTPRLTTDVSPDQQGGEGRRGELPPRSSAPRNEDTHHIGWQRGSGGAEHHQGRTKDLTLGTLPNGQFNQRAFYVQEVCQAPC